MIIQLSAGAVSPRSSAGALGFQTAFFDVVLPKVSLSLINASASQILPLMSKYELRIVPFGLDSFVKR